MTPFLSYWSLAVGSFPVSFSLCHTLAPMASSAPVPPWACTKSRIPGCVPHGPCTGSTLLPALRDSAISWRLHSHGTSLPVHLAHPPDWPRPVQGSRSPTFPSSRPPGFSTPGHGGWGGQDGTAVLLIPALEFCGSQDRSPSRCPPPPTIPRRQASRQRSACTFISRWARLAGCPPPCTARAPATAVPTAVILGQPHGISEVMPGPPPASYASSSVSSSFPPENGLASWATFILPRGRRGRPQPRCPQSHAAPRAGQGHTSPETVPYKGQRSDLRPAQSSRVKKRGFPL